MTENQSEHHQATSSPQRDMVERNERYTSHALVEVRKYKWFPFFVHSAVLLDISHGGCKMEFTAEVPVKAGDQYWISIPLSPLGIFSPSRLECLFECRWFDKERYRMGGVFMNLVKNDKQTIDQVIETLKDKGFLR